MISRRLGLRVLLVVTIAILVVDLLLPRIPQPQSYHAFADQRSFLGIPHFADVVSNVPFAIFGLWGLTFLLRYSSEELPEHFLDRRERWFYVIISVGLFCVAFGSGYYHLAPDNDRLVWDRLPMTVVFMSLIAALIAERINLRAGLWLLPVLLLIGVASVLQWHLSEMRGAGDLRFYGTVQAYAVIFVLLALLFPSPYSHGSDLLWIAGFYILAKVLETLDKPIFNLGQIVSGHTLKHLAAATAGYSILRMVKRRRPIPSATV
ncbi:MAG TPA: hypothetical protein VF214_11305 [Edaphobacter sp.]